MHAEAGKGQFEFALGYTTCLTAADDLVYTREVIKAVARKHGLLATFIPKYVWLRINGHHLITFSFLIFSAFKCTKDLIDMKEKYFGIFIAPNF